MDLIDESGEIRLTAFRDQVDKYYDYIQVDKECVDADDSAIPTTKYDFVTIDKIANAEVNSLIDVIGVTKSVEELQTFQVRSTGRELKKKEVLLVDHSKTGITLTLWSSDAENFDGVNNPVIVLKSVKIGEFGGGKNIFMISNSTLKVNPEMKKCYRLRGWYDSQGSIFEANNISARSGLRNFNTPWMSFKEMQDQNLGNAERGDYYRVMGTVLLIRSENAMYKACPTSDCNKKITDLENGMYRCEKCNREFPNFKWHLLASMNVGDWSENQWVSMFSSEMDKVLGMTSEEVGQKLDQNPKAISAITDKAHFKQFVLKCRAEMETYNDESHLKTVVLKVDPINFEKYNAHLIERIEQLME
ncbi:replication protein A 70 kDa DNA-binding subunit-like [Leptinotarsa decemlineata]|uniref:replication protein A 70 kDa DNA-binding subunit-like n=1 Tax=Leptinotarsa decemlineata TaxID=7539 RepID=UPI003D3082BD